jgi:hypothetical protein
MVIIQGMGWCGSRGRCLVQTIQPDARELLPGKSNETAGALRPGFFLVRQAWRVARKRNLGGGGSQLSDLGVKVPYTPGKGKC